MIVHHELERRSERAARARDRILRWFPSRPSRDRAPDAALAQAAVALRLADVCEPSGDTLTTRNRAAFALHAARAPRALCPCGFEECFFVNSTIASQRSRRTRFSTILVERLGVRGVVVGTTFRFGHRRAGDVRLMGEVLGTPRRAARSGRTGKRAPASGFRARAFARSSSASELAQADGLLGGIGYEIRGPVEIGAGRGHTLGFPTANVRVPAKLLPKDGVYSALRAVRWSRLCRARFDRDESAVRGGDRTVEVWLRDFQQTIYGRELGLRDLRFLREQRLFAGVGELVEQMELDRQAIQLSELWIGEAQPCSRSRRARSPRARAARRRARGLTRSPTSGNPAPDWSRASIPGPTLSFASFRGKAVYLNFFATWCPPCNEEAPSIDALAREYGARGVQIVGIDVLRTRARPQQFRNEHNVSYPVVVRRRHDTG